ncbi:UDP-N-acetylmuramate--L-alanine ligase [Oceanivirga salmonicida]|uniref:UDP-N-acetylmuramate--L-alanine ligase n=1 Tax=Oceanivirga salmonicida TaxID=1769291 RepID=UPI0012E1470C|nr:UDP-N-acetylmuramate--L-alanine ligase [Oceanivirga salmonicida]
MRIYFSGINGIGMSGIAKILNEQGHIVEGSDLEYKDITNDLENMGITVNIGQSLENIENFEPDLYVYSTAIKETNPEYLYAKNKGIEMKRRGEILADLFNKFDKTIAVAGTHGKTTTSSMVALSFLETKPYIVVGGIIPELNTNSQMGDSDYFIVEADESDNSFLHLHPKYSIITNVEADHLEHHGNLENIKKSFVQFIKQTRDKVIISKDCPTIKSLDLDEFKDKIVYYSILEKTADICVKNIKVEGGITKFEVLIHGKSIGEVSLTVPGVHNVSNSLSVIYLAYLENLDMDIVKEHLLRFTGAKRRYQVIYDEEIKVIDDYAHHPTEIKATINAAKSKEKGRITVIFEPHRYTRTKYFLNDFAKSLLLADKIILLPIYAASEENESNISSSDLANKIKELDNDKQVCVMLPEELMNHIYLNNKPNDVYIFMGAGTVSKFAYSMVNKMKG